MKKNRLLFALAVFSALSCTASADGNAIETIISDDNIVVEFAEEKQTDEGYVWTINVENKMEQEILFSLSPSYLNSLCVAPYESYLRLSPKESGSIDVLWQQETLDLYQVGDITSVSCVMSAFNTETYESCFENAYTYYPDGEENAVPYSYTPDDNDIVLVDNDQYSVICTETEKDSWGEAVSHILFQNKSDVPLYFSGDGFTLNGSTVMDSQYLNCVLEGGLSQYQDLSWADYFFTDTGLTFDDVASCSFNLEITDWSTYSSLATESCMLTFKEGSDIPTSPTEPSETEAASEAESETEALSEKIPVEVNPVENVKNSGAEGKTWADFFGK